MSKEERRLYILESGIKYINVFSFKDLSIYGLARFSNISVSLIRWYFYDLKGLKNQLIKHAIMTWDVTALTTIWLDDQSIISSIPEELAYKVKENIRGLIE